MKASSVDITGPLLRIRVAAGFLARARGLLWRPSPAPGCGLLLPGVRRVHGFGLRAALDLAWLDREGRLIACAQLRPWSVASCAAASHVVELRHGECRRLGLQHGRELRLAIVADIFGSPDATPRQSHRRLGSLFATIATVLAGMMAVPPPADAQPAARAAMNPDPSSVAATPASSRPAAVPPSQPATPVAAPTVVDRYAGEPRRQRVRKARGSLQREASDGTPAKPLRKPRSRRARTPVPPVEYLVGEPPGHGSARGR